MNHSHDQIAHPKGQPDRTGLSVRALAASVAAATAATCLIISPRFCHSFPSLVDDWFAISTGTEFARHAITLGNPETLRYRPGWLIWNWLQWHTLGAPTSFIGPQVWNLLRILALVTGLVLVTDLLTRDNRQTSTTPAWMRWLLVTSVPVFIATVPMFAVDLARYGPQEPLLVGCIATGGALLYAAVRRLSREAMKPGTAALVATGSLLWAFGVLQKEPSISVLILAPFVLLALRADRTPWASINRRNQYWIGLVAVAMLLPLVPMLVRTAGLGLADDQFYADQGAKGSLLHKTISQATSMPDAIGTKLVVALFAFAAASLLAAWTRRGTDWISIGLLATGSATVLFAAKVGVVTSRYYLPMICLTSIVFARSAARIGRSAVSATAAALLTLAAIQAYFAYDHVTHWATIERAEEQVVREAAARVAGGCKVNTTGAIVEMAAALPVLVPLANEKPRACDPPERFVIVIDGSAGRVTTAANDHLVAACEPAVEIADVRPLARILRCAP